MNETKYFSSDFFTKSQHKMMPKMLVEIRIANGASSGHCHVVISHLLFMWDLLHWYFIPKCLNYKLNLERMYQLASKILTSFRCSRKDKTPQTAQLNLNCSLLTPHRHWIRWSIVDTFEYWSEESKETNFNETKKYKYSQEMQNFPTFLPFSLDRNQNVLICNNYIKAFD